MFRSGYIISVENEQDRWESLDISTVHKAIAIMTFIYWHRERQRKQWSRGPIDRRPRMPALTCDKGAHWREVGLKWV